MDTPTCDVIRGRFPKLLVTANHTTPGGMSPAAAKLKNLENFTARFCKDMYEKLREL